MAFNNILNIRLLKQFTQNFFQYQRRGTKNLIFWISDSTVYNGTWSVYFVKRNFSSDLMGMKDIRTGKITFDEGVVYEMSDDKFIFNLMNFPKHSCFEMTNLFDILKKNYKLIEGVGENGGYHAQVFMSSLFSQMDFS